MKAKRFHELSIKGRLTAAVVGVVLALIVLGATAVAIALSSQQVVGRFVDGELASLRQVAELNRDMGWLRRYEKDIFIEMDNANEVAAQYALWTQTLARVRERLSQLGQGQTGLETQQRIQEVEAALARYATGFDKVAVRVKDGALDNAAAANRLMSRVKEDFALAEKGAEGFYSLLLASADAQRQSAVQRGRWSVVAALSIVAIMVLMWFTGRSIVRPVASAQQLARAIAQGDLRTPVQVRGGGEMAQLMDALRTMQDALVKLVEEIQQATRSIATASFQMASGNLDLSHRTESAAAHLAQTNSTMVALSQAIGQAHEAAVGPVNWRGLREMRRCRGGASGESGGAGNGEHSQRIQTCG